MSLLRQASRVVLQLSSNVNVLLTDLVDFIATAPDLVRSS